MQKYRTGIVNNETLLNTMKLVSVQQGVALIMVLLVVTLATFIAVAMTTRQQLNIRRTANIIHSEQATLYALAGESWVKHILFDDGNNTTIDNFNEIWATALPPLPISGGFIQVQLEDLQSRFNLNNLVLDDQPSLPDILIFERLLTLLNLSPDLAQVVVDWIDSNQEPQLPHGAEDNVYLIKTPAYRTANRLLRSRSELRLLAGFDTDSYHQLLPYISVLPTRTAINVNTVPVPLLMALVEGLSETDAQTLIAARLEKPFNSLQDFLIQDALAGLKVETSNLALASHYFRFTASVQVERGKAYLNSILHRLPDRIEVVLRTQDTAW